MAKEAYYFSHDANARQDPKILEMMSVYGLEGYGRYWVLVEMLREQSDFTLKLSGKYSFNALAMQMQCTADAAEKFVHDCVNEFELFKSNEEVFWSESLLRRMAMKEETSQKRRKAAEARWGKKPDTSTLTEETDANGMQMHSTSNANGMQGKEKKVKEIKVKDKKIKHLEHVLLTDDEYRRLIKDFKQSAIDSKIEDLNNYIGSTGKKYRDHNLTLRAWIKRDKENEKAKQQEGRKYVKPETYRPDSVDLGDEA